MTITSIRRLCILFLVVFLGPLSAFAEQSRILLIDGALDRGALSSVIPAKPTFESLAAESVFSTIADVPDANGSSRTLLLYFFHDTSWKLAVVADGADLAKKKAGKAKLLAAGELSLSDNGKTVGGRIDVSVRWRGQTEPSTVVLLLHDLKLSSVSSISSLRVY